MEMASYLVNHHYLFTIQIKLGFSPLNLFFFASNPAWTDHPVSCQPFVLRFTETAERKIWRYPPPGSSFLLPPHLFCVKV